MFVGNQASTVVAANGTYIWNVKYITNSNISYDTTTGTFTFRIPGYYRIHVDTSGSATGDIKPVLVFNGTASTTALGEASSTGAGDYVNISFDTVQRIVSTNNNNFATLSVINSGVAETVVVSNIVIERIG